STISQPSISKEKLKKLDSIATQDVPLNAPGIATAIIENGKVIYKKYAGYANLKDSSLIKENTRFNIASNGKQFTALAILTLIEDKKISLQDDVRKFYPTLYQGLKEKITIQSLLNHTSGIRDCYDIWSLQGFTWWKKSFSNKDVLELINKQRELNFKPNTQYLYSNTNYILLALIIEKVTKKSFVQFTNEMFQQLNMPHTSFVNDYTKIDGHIAKAYFNFNTWTTYDWIWNVCGDGNIFSTLDDLIQWEKIIQGITTVSIRKSVITKSQQTIKGSKFLNYGYGLEFGEYKKLQYTFHEGATGAWKATVIKFPSKKTSFITLTNTGKSIPSIQTRQMADVLFDLQTNENYLITKPASVGNFISDDEVVGTYLTENDFAFQFEKKDRSIFLRRIGRNDVELEREANNIFHQKYDTLFKQEFNKNLKGELQVTGYYINHSPYSLTKVNNKMLLNEFSQRKGKYYNQETNTTIEITSADNKVFDVQIGSNQPTKALLISANKILVNNYSISFDSTSTDVLYLNGERIKNIKYIKLTN
nr:beta-lactamase family protein [Chitinophagaceae bacterium]